VSKIQIQTAGGDSVRVESKPGQVDLAGLILLPHEAEKLVDALQLCAARAEMMATAERYRAKYAAKAAQKSELPF
jgi:hypothetical protein